MAKDAAFSLHQATERACICFLLLRTLYFARSHNIKLLRSLAEDYEPRLIEARPRDRRIDRRRFQLHKRAYVEARYSTVYDVTIEETWAILASVRALRNIVERVSRKRLKQLREAALRKGNTTSSALALDTPFATVGGKARNDLIAR